MIFPAEIFTCQWLYDVIVTSLKWAVWLQPAIQLQTVHSASNGPFIPEWPVREVLCLLTISNSRVPPDGSIGPVEGGPSQEVSLSTALCPSGVSKAWLHSALFQKALFQFPFSERLPFRKGPSHCNIVAVLAVALTYLHWAICEPVPRPLDNPGCWNGCSNLTSFAPWSASVTPDVSKFRQKT